ASILLPMGLEAACAGATVGTSIGAVVAAAFLIRSHRSNRHVYESVPHVMGGDAGAGPRTAWGAGALLRRIGSYSVPIVLTIGLQYAGNLIDVAVTKSRLMSGGFIEAEASQLYSHLYKYQQLLNAPIAISAALAATILPAVAAAIASGDREALNGRVGFAYKLCFSVTIPCMVGFTVLSGPIYGLLKYGDGSDLLMYGSACLVLLATVQIQTSILQGLGRLYAVNRNLMLGIAAKIALNYLLVPIPGLNIKGAIIGSVFSYLIPIALNAATLKGHSRRNPGMAVDRGARAHLWKPLASSAYMGFIVFISHRLACLALSFVPSPYAVEAIASVAAVAAGVASYLYFLRSFKGIDAEMLDMLPRRMASKLARLIEK
ncbi:MAG: polysaccharide biosynthesis C-terminal domain-containing protein, partial [Oscillospiraceae bacterium]|nr:polysaccharide biosynthesis C-terminal domain-containing protein [Oscillospiraceae bacterium]